MRDVLGLRYGGRMVRPDWVVMTKKDFERLASDLGFAMRDRRGNKSMEVHEAEVKMLFEVADSLGRIYPRFNEARFIEWAIEVANGQRGWDGKKVA